MMTDPRQIPDAAEAERLRRENEELKRQLAGLQQPAPKSSGERPAIWRPSGLTISALCLMAVVIVVVAFFAGYLPMQKRNALIVAEAQEAERSAPRVEVTPVLRSTGASELRLPGSIQAIEEAPVLARADGYLVKRMADIGDTVRAGQPLAEIEAPEMDEQIRQARASLQQAKANVNQAASNLKKGQADAEFSRLTAERYASLAAQGVVSRQDNDRYRSDHQAQLAALQSLEDGINVQKSNVAAAEASLARLERLKEYLTVKAPFDGVITVRNVEAGALVSSGNTLLFRIAQTRVVRTYVNVPQAYAGSVREGQAARLSVTELPGREFTGTVARNAKALDPSSRTLLVEIHVPNTAGTLLPGMYARVDLVTGRKDSPLVIPSDAMIVRADGTSVATVHDNKVRLRKIEVGRDYGDHIEVLRGLDEGDLVIQNPGDLARDGLTVETVRAGAK
jgi:RND family efflux transporter MFP subunit